MRAGETSTARPPGGVRAEGLEGRLLFAAGDPDPTFGTLGAFRQSFAGHDEAYALALAVQGDGRYVAVGQAYRPYESGRPGNEIALARCNPDGTPDVTFGAGGTVATDLGHPYEDVRAAVALPGGGLLVAGSAPGEHVGGPQTSDNLLLLRYTAAGALDPTFGPDHNGAVYVDLAGAEDYAQAMAVQPDGRILLVGISVDRVGGDARYYPSHLALARFNPDGTLDATFGVGGPDGDGRVRTPDGLYATGAAVAVLPDGKILAAGTSKVLNPGGTDGDADVLLARFNPDGTPDPTFGPGGADGDGVVVCDVAFRDEIGHDLLVQRPGGRIILTDGSYLGSRVVGFRSDGAPDPAFGTAGDGTTRVDDFAGRAVALDPRGRIVVGGSYRFEDSMFVRLTADGLPDPTFGRNGRAVLAVTPGSAYDVIYDVAVLPDGRVVGTGEAGVPAPPYGRTMTITRLLGDPPATSVTGRSVFYNDSVFDARDPAATAADLSAIAAGKRPLLPGQAASFENVTSYTKGINGLLIDFAGMTPGALSADDFEFRVGASSDPAAWPQAPAPTSVLLIPDPTNASLTRYAITWVDGANRNTWLRVTVKANADTGLAAPDVFYFGNLAGEAAGNDLRVTASDYAAVRMNLGRPAAINSSYDFDRNGRVDALDLLTVRANLYRGLSQLDAPAVAAAASPVAAPFADQRIGRLWDDVEQGGVA